MKQQLERLKAGESLLVKCSSRTGIYTTAKRAGIQVKTEPVEDHILVTRIDAVTPVSEVIERIGRLSKTDRLEVLQSFETCCGMAKGSCTCSPVRTQPARDVIREPDIIATPAPVVEPEPMPEPVADQWAGWSDERETIDLDRGETVTYREHLKTRKRREIRRETCDYSA